MEFVPDEPPPPEQLGLLKAGKIARTARCGPEGLCMEQSSRSRQSRQQQPGCTEDRRNHVRNLTERNRVVCCHLENY